MPLQSQLFCNDLKLEAAAVSDPAHIVPGATGEHVQKIQLALIRLDGAAIDADGIYGPATSAAVLTYKQKRNIINTAYQKQPDNIVGKMTIKALDEELVNAPNPAEDQSAEVGAAVLAVLFQIDAILGPRNVYINVRLRYRLELLRIAAALASKGNLHFGGQIRAEYERGLVHLREIGFQRGPIVFAAAPLVAAGAAATALEIAIAALALVLTLCIISEDFRKGLSQVVEEDLAAISDAILGANQEARIIRVSVRRCNDSNPNPKPKCRDRRNEFDQKDSEFKTASSEATRAITNATIRLLQLSDFEWRLVLSKVVKLEKALKALKDAANALFDNCGCIFPKF